MSPPDPQLPARLSRSCAPDARTAAEFRAAADARLETKLGGELTQRLLLALGAQPARSRGG